MITLSSERALRVRGWGVGGGVWELNPAADGRQETGDALWEVNCVICGPCRTCTPSVSQRCAVEAHVHTRRAAMLRRRAVALRRRAAMLRRRAAALRRRAAMLRRRAATLRRRA